MVNLLRRDASNATLFQLGADLSWLFLAVLLADRLDGGLTSPFTKIAAPALVFSVLVVCAGGALGLYRRDKKASFGTQVRWLFLALVIGVSIAFLVAPLLPGGDEFQKTLGLVVMIAFTGRIAVRHVVVEPILHRYLPHRLLVLGTGPEARDVEATIASAGSTGMQLVGFFPLERVEEMAVTRKLVITGGGSVQEVVDRYDIQEIIVAVRQQRGGVLPLRGLLDCRLRGVQITDLPGFYERANGRVPIESAKASWLIYGSGFRQNWLRLAVKRTFDVVVAATLLFLMAPVMAVVALLIALESGAPIIYRQERVGLRGVPFIVLKFRSMRKDAEKDGTARWADKQDARVTPLGRFLRRSRIDELPQLFNVLTGEMSFVGPRPERPTFVEMLTEKVPFYAVRHSVKPGLTGWAQVRYSYGATVEDSIRKLEYDLYYVKNNTAFLDLLILLETVRVVLLGEGAR